MNNTPDSQSPLLAPSSSSSAGPAPAKFLDQLRLALQQSQTDPALGDQYLDLVKQFTLFHGKRHPAALGAAKGAARTGSQGRECPMK
jgi:hypothetical protein